MHPARPTGRTGSGRSDAGRVSVFLAIGMFAVFMIVGLSVDGAGQLFAQQRAHNIAAEAARAGGQVIDEGQAIDGGPKVIDVGRAIEAATAYRTAAGATGASPTVGADRRTITVEATVNYQPVMLRYFGWAETIPLTESATAQLLDAPVP